jgi:hypothetical protein
MLSPPRSFSSVVSTMLGEHPEMYGFPELHLFLGDTIQAVIDRESRNAPRYSGPPGVLRTLAELHDGTQTVASAIRAAAWINERRDWSTKRLLDYLIEKVAPRIGVEKSPPTALKMQFLERAYAYYPDAYYLHLTRHPIPARNSMKEFQEERRALRGADVNKQGVDQLIIWHHIHTNILRFTETLPLGQTMRVKGEDVLSDPDVYLPQIAEWMGLRTDKEAIEAMKRPENSPYASVGPEMARGGNDPKFMRDPVLRRGKVRQPSLEDFFRQEEAEEIQWFSSSFIEAVSQSPLRVASPKDVQDQISDLAALFGYF